MDYENIPPRLGMVISSGLATLNELQTCYGGRDLYDLVEIVAVDARNRRVAQGVGRKG